MRPHPVFTNGEGKPTFHELPRLRTDEVADVLQVVRVRILRHLARRGLVIVDGDALEVQDDLAQRDPPMAQLAAAAVLGLAPAGPTVRRHPVRLAAGPDAGPEIRGPLLVADRGFNLHARTCAGALDEVGRLALLKYVLRPPVANDRLTFTSDRKVRIALKRALSTAPLPSTSTPLALLFRLAATVPAPGSTPSATPASSPPPLRCARGSWWLRGPRETAEYPPPSCALTSHLRRRVHVHRHRREVTLPDDPHAPTRTSGEPNIWC